MKLKLMAGIGVGIGAENGRFGKQTWQDDGGALAVPENVWVTTVYRHPK